MTVAAAQFAMIGFAAAQSNMKPADIPAVKPGTNTSFAPLKQNDAGILSVGYAKPVLPMALLSSFYMAGPMRFTAM